MPNYLNFPGCCTAKVLAGFGQERTAEYAYRPNGPNINEISEEDLIKDLNKHIRSAKYQGEGLLTAITTQNQKIANKVLRQFGFKSSRFTSKKTHNDTYIKIWYGYVEELEEIK